ncbi:TPA: tyrosine-type recombinase/integrase [Salmonella enterica subsp. enterica serovar Muenchen]
MVLSTKSLWHGLERKSERVRNSDLGRWLSAIEMVRKKAEEERDDFAQSVCDSVFLAMFTGLRKSEILNLTWDRVNLGGRYFWINKTKNGDPLELPITKSLLTLFRRRLALREEEENESLDLVFPGQSGGVIGEPRRVINKIVAATIPDPNPDDLPQVNFKFHDARRTYGSAAALAGLDGYIIKRLMNHRTARSADVTQGYLHFGADELQESAEKVECFILEKAGLIESRRGLDSQLYAALDSLSDDEKRKIIFDVLNKDKNAGGLK